MPSAAGVVDEKGSEYILAHTGPRELDGHPLGRCGSGFGLVPGYTTLSVRVWANIQFGALEIKSARTNEQSAVGKTKKKKKFYRRAPRIFAFYTQKQTNKHTNKQTKQRLAGPFQRVPCGLTTPGTHGPSKAG